MDITAKPKTAPRSCFATAIMLVLLAGGNILAENKVGVVSATDWCGTQRIYEEEYRQRHGTAASPGPCGENHPCDDPVARDTWIPDGSEGIQQIRMIIHVLALDDGSELFSTSEHVAGQVAQLNADFAQVGIEFLYQINQVNSSAWRFLSEGEIDLMKQATAIQPDRYLNVWVTIVEFSYSFATFPWSYDALGPTGGIVMGHFHWVSLPNRVFAHEVGHALGLYHTFHGVDEVSPCTVCYETPTANSSLKGDLCADTPPTPTNSGGCGDFGGNDGCSGEPWGYTMPENYMGYAAQICLDTFTPEQRGRLRCWSDYMLDNWAIPFRVEADVILGPAPLAVSFEPSTHKTATAWQWDLGDGETHAGQSPTHTYSDPGLKDVSVTMETSGKSYALEFPGLISAYADTIKIGQGSILGLDGQVDVYARNYLPLNRMEIPFRYDGEIDIDFKSVSAEGFRSETAGARLTGIDNVSKRASILIGGFGDELPAGQGPVATLFFRLMQPGAPGEITIDTISYSHKTLQFVAAAGSYVPVLEEGSLWVSCCEGFVGDANSDGQSRATISDVSVLIANLFIDGMAIECYAEADINQSGGPNPTARDITIGDISMLVDHLFITGVPLPHCQ